MTVTATVTQLIAMPFTLAHTRTTAATVTSPPTHAAACATNHDNCDNDSKTETFNDATPSRTPQNEPPTTTGVLPTQDSSCCKHDGINIPTTTTTRRQRMSLGYRHDSSDAMTVESATLQWESEYYDNRAAGLHTHSTRQNPCPIPRKTHTRKSQGYPLQSLLTTPEQDFATLYYSNAGVSVVFHPADYTLTSFAFIAKAVVPLATKKTTYGIPGTTTSNDETSTPNNGNTISPNKHPSTKRPVKKGLDPMADNEEADGRRGKARQAPKANVQVKATMPTHALPNRVGRNVHPAGLPKIWHSKEQIEANCEAGVKALKEKIHAVQMAKEHLAQMNIMEEREEDDLLSTTIHKRRHVDIETDSDECFDLKDVDHGSDEDSSSESDKAAKTKTKSQSKKCVKGAARQELLMRTEELRSVEHSQGRQKVKHDVGGFTAQDLHCKKYANSGLRLGSFTPANAAQLQQPEVADPFELGGLCDDNLEETCLVVAEVKGLQYNLSCGNELVRVGKKTEDINLGTKPQAACKAPKSKATKATVKKGASFKSLESPFVGACPDIAQECLDDLHWTRVFLPTLSHALYITDNPFTDWTWESNTLLQTVQNVFNLSFTNISYMLSVQDKVVKAAYDRMKTRRSKIASDILILVKTFFEGTEFRN
ncbi:hypothetical protein EDB85DRAFT_1893108 [Lactarius pseudohatsudake]|nr:hypothetical protein EDB85DRAFT_1893108 [Lactarius pseudohatsudake]